MARAGHAAIIDPGHATNGKVDRRRPLCPYPQIAHYKGTGSIDEAGNFFCAEKSHVPASR
ncbi:MAG TPA: tannase/feruloyl esterase family alpha/beta hydrolase [Vicinamibacterales bacterium]